MVHWLWYFQFVCFNTKCGYKILLKLVFEELFFKNFIAFQFLLTRRQLIMYLYSNCISFPIESPVLTSQLAIKA